MEDWIGKDVHDRDGDKVGTIDSLYTDGQTEDFVWATVATGFFGTQVHFVPVSLFAESDEGLVVDATKEKIKDAPRIEPDEELNQEENEELYRYYDLDGYDSGDIDDTDDGHDVSGPDTDSAMTRSEEELHVGTRQRERGKVRLKKYIVTEHVQKTVPVQKEEVRVERSPITDENIDQAMSGPELSEEDHEVTLNEEVPVVEKKTVPKERIALNKDVTTDEAEVDEEVRKEQVDVDGDDRR